MSSSRAWALAATAISIVAILTLAGYLALRALTRAPAEVVRSGSDALAEIARAFREGNIETRFRSYATTVSGVSYLQFASLEAVEIFERKDSATVLWGQLPLPDIVVEARVPVTYTYYLDLEDAWRISMEGSRVVVEAPGIGFNPPAADPSRLELRVTEDSLFRDSEAAKSGLQTALKGLLEDRAVEKVELVREVGRQRVEAFVRDWILHDFPTAGDIRIVVLFEGEEGPAITAPEIVE